MQVFAIVPDAGEAVYDRQNYWLTCGFCCVIIQLGPPAVCQLKRNADAQRMIMCRVRSEQETRLAQWMMKGLIHKTAHIFKRNHVIIFFIYHWQNNLCCISLIYYCSFLFMQMRLVARNLYGTPTECKNIHFPAMLKTCSFKVCIFYFI